MPLRLLVVLLIVYDDSRYSAIVRQVFRYAFYLASYLSRLLVASLVTVLNVWTWFEFKRCGRSTRYSINKFDDVASFFKKLGKSGKVGSKTSSNFRQFPRRFFSRFLPTFQSCTKSGKKSAKIGLNRLDGTGVSCTCT